MHKALVIALAALFAVPGAAMAQPASAATEATAQTPLEARADQVIGVINGTIAPETVFSQAFLAAVPPAQLKTVSAGLTAQFGAAVAVDLLDPRDGTRAVLHVRFERGLAKGSIAIAPAEGNRISELLFTAFDSLSVAGDTPEKISADLAALPGSVNAWFAPLDGSAPIISIGADKPLALGSTFKIYVLAALAEDVKAGKLRWTDVVPLTQKSYPSGRLQDWPQDAPLTLHTLASLMISISDNTATDQLIAVQGKDRILKLMRDSGHDNAAANDPFLNTRELFVLKASDPSQLDQWRKSDAVARTAILTALGQSRPPLDQVNAAFAAGPKALDIEWFASPANLAKLLAHMRRTADPEVFKIMAISPSATPAIKANWNYIGFKGGSEPGVINLTWLLTDKAGLDHILTLGWNNPAAVVDEGKLEAIAQRILLLPR
jgi:beta-lactamase class A